MVASTGAPRLTEGTSLPPRSTSKPGELTVNRSKRCPRRRGCAADHRISSAGGRFAPADRKEWRYDRSKRRSRAQRWGGAPQMTAASDDPSPHPPRRVLIAEDEALIR